MAEDIPEGADVLMGTLLVLSRPTKVLFDSGASHSFIARSYVGEYNLRVEHTLHPLLINAPGSEMLVQECTPRITITFGKVDIATSLLMIELKGIDVILGMNWMKKHDAVLFTARRLVSLANPTGGRLSVHLSGNGVGLYHLKEKADPDINSIPVVCEYPDVFPDELPGMPPDQAVEFAIELEPGTTPISKRPYPMSINGAC